MLDYKKLRELDYRNKIIQFKDVKGSVNDEADVVIVGSGAGGAAAALNLTRAGLKVITVEAGGYYPLKFLNFNFIDMAKLLYWNKANVGPADGSLRISHGKAVGGSTMLHMLTMVPIPEFTLERWQKLYGLSNMTNTNLLPLTNQVRKVMNIKPITKKHINHNAQAFVDGCDKLGVLWNLNDRNAGDCNGFGRCHTGCATGGKVSMDVSFMPLAIESGLKVYTDAMVEKIDYENGRATGLSAVIKDRANGKIVAQLKIKAKVVISSAGALQTPALLKRSKIKDPHSMIGSRLHAQPGINIMGEFEKELHGWRGITNPVHIDEWQPLEKGGFFCEPGLMDAGIFASGFPGFGSAHQKLMQRYKHMAGGEVLLNDDGKNGSVDIDGDGNAVINYELSRTDRERMRKGLRNIGEVLLAGGAKKIYVPHRKPIDISSRAELKKLKNITLAPNDVIMNSVHCQGTCLMSNVPEKGVVNPQGETHQLKNLFIADASVFPDGIGTNTTVASATMATYITDGIIANKEAIFGKK